MGKDGYLFEKFEYTDKEKKHLVKVSNVVNKFAENIEIPIYFMLIPNSIYINQDKLPDNLEIYSQEKIIEEFYDLLDSKIEKIETIDLLMENKDKYIFFKTDHHMTSLGAYIAYAKFCIQKGKMPVNIKNLDSVTVSNRFLGTFDSKAQIYNQEMDYIDVYLNENNVEVKEAQYDNDVRTQSIFNEEYLKKKDKYSFFLNGNNAKVVVKTNVNNGKKILLIKDSYAHIMAQFLCNEYEEIHFIDPRYYKISLSEYVVENGITEVLFLYNVSNIVEDLGLLTLK